MTIPDPPRVTAERFHAADGVPEWRVLFWGAHAHWRCGSLAEGARFVAAVAEAAEATRHEPDVDLRPDGVTVRTCSTPAGALGERDVELARAVSRAARALGLVADPSRLQAVNIAVAAAASVDVAPFWLAALGYTAVGDEDAVDPQRRGPALWFHELPAAGRGRTHIDVSVPADVAEDRVRAALAAGGRLVDDSAAPDAWTIASPDNHGIDIAAWPDTEG